MAALDETREVRVSMTIGLEEFRAQREWLTSHAGDDHAEGLMALCDAIADAMREDETRERLEYLRGELRAERISYGELLELQGLAHAIDPSDVELLEAAGVPEHTA